MKQLENLWKKDTLLAIGLMSGTSADGMDAALVEIEGSGRGTRVRQRAFVSLPYPGEVRAEILRLAEGRVGGSHDLCLFSYLLGQLSLEACLAVCEQAGVRPGDVDLVGSHGQTLYHIPTAETYLGRSVRGTLQLGEPSVIAEGLPGCVVVSDFRPRDLAAGGQGAPLVPYAEYLLCREEGKTVALQNIGGIGNLTVLPKGGAPEDTYAFDTGPGNMIMDQLCERMSDGRTRYDEDGRLAASGRVSEELLSFLKDDPFLSRKPPKSTGREFYGAPYVDRLVARGQALSLRWEDMIATAARFTAECIRISVERFCPDRPDYLVVCGGGSMNPTLMGMIRESLPMPVCRGEDKGWDSGAKEAIAFAILANECVHGLCNNVPSVTGAGHPVVMGKITL